MAYSTQSDIEARLTADELVSLADLDEDGTADAAVITQAIADADALIDSYVRTRGLDVPLDPVPRSVQQASVTLAIYNLALGRQSVSEDVGKARDDTVAWLRDIAAGKATLGLDDDHTGAEPAQAGGVKHDAEDRVYGRGKMKGW